MSKGITIDELFFESSAWKEKRVFSRAEAMLYVQYELANKGELSITLRSLTNLFGWGMSRTEKFVMNLKERYASTKDGRYILNSEAGRNLAKCGVVSILFEDGNGSPQENINASFVEKCEYFISNFNIKRAVKGKPAQYKMTEKVKSQLRARIKEGYTSEHIFKALQNILLDEYHKNQEPPFKYVTPGYITRSEVLERYGNIDKNNLAQAQSVGPVTNAQKRRAGLLPKA